MDLVTYKIGQLTFTQNELTWKQDKQLLKLFNRFISVSDNDENVVTPRLFELLQKYDLLDAALGIILKPKWDLKYILYFIWQLLKYPFTWRISRVNVDELSNSEIREIKDDFFLLNKSVMTKLNDVGNALSWIARMNMDPEPTETNSEMQQKKESKLQPMSEK